MEDKNDKINFGLLRREEKLVWLKFSLHRSIYKYHLVKNLNENITYYFKHRHFTHFMLN